MKGDPRTSSISAISPAPSSGASSTRRRRDQGEAPQGRDRASERPLAGKVLAMVFDKPSTRTRVSFDVGMRELGGETLMLTGKEMQLGRGETIADTARVLSRYVDAIMIRTLDHEMVLELAEYATIPVINGLTKTTASLPDHGRRDDLRGASRADRGRDRRLDGRRQQRARLLGHAAARLDFTLRIASPPELARVPSFCPGRRPRERDHGDHRPFEAAEGADAS